MRRALLLAAAAPMAAAPGSAQSLADRVTVDSRRHGSYEFRGTPRRVRRRQWKRLDPRVAQRRHRHSASMDQSASRSAATIATRSAFGLGSAASWGAPASSEIDLGEVSSEDAARYLVALVHSIAGRNADEAMSGAVFADAVDISPAPPRDRRRRRRAARVAEAGALLVRPGRFADERPRALYDTLDAGIAARTLHFRCVATARRRVAQQVVRALRSADRDPQIRKQAMFWLGQSKDPRATKFFHDLLTP